MILEAGLLTWTFMLASSYYPKKKNISKIGVVWWWFTKGRKQRITLNKSYFWGPKIPKITRVTLVDLFRSHGWATHPNDLATVDVMLKNPPDTWVTWGMMLTRNIIFRVFFGTWKKQVAFCFHLYTLKPATVAFRKSTFLCFPGSHDTPTAVHILEIVSGLSASKVWRWIFKTLPSELNSAFRTRLQKLCPTSDTLMLTAPFCM